MKLVNRDNYLNVKAYLDHLINQKNQQASSVSRYWFLLKHSLRFAMETPFTHIHTLKPGFNSYVNSLQLSNESKKKIILHTRKFLNWCKDYKEHEYKNLSRVWVNDLTAIAADPNHDLTYVTEEEIHNIAELRVDPNNLALMRDQAAACLLYLSGIRGGALATLPIEAVILDPDQPHLLQYPELGVKTKNHKRAKTFLYSIPELLEPIRKWDEIVRSKYGEHFLWYTPIEQNWGDQQLPAVTNIPGKNREIALNKRIRHLWELLYAPHKSPHKFRHGSAIYGVRRCVSMADYHILSRNLMHSSIKITDEYYVHFEEDERGKMICFLSTKPNRIEASPAPQKSTGTYAGLTTGLDQGLVDLLRQHDSKDLLRALSLVSLEIANN